MPIKDPFSYSARWGSVGVDCAYCIHFVGPSSWPDRERTSHCGLHNVSLAIEIGKNGYKEGEWFCKDFADNGRAYRKAVEELQTTKDLLHHGVLYSAYGEDGLLREIPLVAMRNSDD